MSYYEYLRSDKILHVDGTELYRIMAIQDMKIHTWHKEIQSIAGSFIQVKSGTLGGYICDKTKLAQDSSWVADGSIVVDSTVEAGTWVGEKSMVIRSQLNRTIVMGNSLIKSSKVYDSFVRESTIEGGSRVKDSSVRNGSKIAAASVVESSKIMHNSVIIESQIMGSWVVDKSAVNESVLNNCIMLSSSVGYSSVSNSIIKNGIKLRGVQMKYDTILRESLTNKQLTAARDDLPIVDD